MWIQICTKFLHVHHILLPVDNPKFAHLLATVAKHHFAV